MQAVFYYIFIKPLILAQEKPSLGTFKSISRSSSNNKEDIDTTIPLTERDIDDGQITALGKLMNSLPLDFSSIRLIYFGYVFGYLTEAIIMAAAMSQQGFWLDDAATKSEGK